MTPGATEKGPTVIQKKKKIVGGKFDDQIESCDQPEHRKPKEDSEELV